MIWIKPCVKWIWYEQYLNYVWLYYTRPLGSIVNIVNKNKQKKSRTSLKKFVDLQNFRKFYKNQILMVANFNFWPFINHPRGHVRSHKNLGKIGLAFWMFIGYKHTDKQSIHIDELCYNIWLFYLFYIL